MAQNLNSRVPPQKNPGRESWAFQIRDNEKKKLSGKGKASCRKRHGGLVRIEMGTGRPLQGIEKVKNAF